MTPIKPDVKIREPIKLQATQSGMAIGPRGWNIELQQLSNNIQYRWVDEEGESKSGWITFMSVELLRADAIILDVVDGNVVWKYEDDQDWTVLISVETFVQDAVAARDKAQEWAEKDVDVPVEEDPDQFSAKHHATKAGERADSVLHNTKNTTKSGTKATEKSGVKSTAKGGVKTTGKAGTKDTAKSGVKGTTKSGVKDTTKAGVKATEKSGVKDTEKAGIKGTVKADIKATTKSEVKGTVKADIKGTTKSAVKDTAKASIKSTVKADIKATEKSGVKDTTKADIKATTKSGTKATTKSEILDTSLEEYAASTMPFTPAGGLSSDNVQDAIVEAASRISISETGESATEDTVIEIEVGGNTYRINVEKVT